jgi:hypothetical protein
MFCYGTFMIGTLMSFVWAGAWFSSGHIDVINALTHVSAVEIQQMGGWTILKATGAFFTGIFTIITWNYPYLDNTVGLLFRLVFLFPITFGVIYGLYELFLPVLQGIASAIRNLLPF